MKHTSGWLLFRVACLVFLLGMALLAIPAQAQNFAYVTSSSNTVSVIDTASNTVVATVAVGSGPLGMAITPDGNRAYVANLFDNTVSVIDTAKKTVVATVALGNGPLAVAITPDGTRAYVTGGPVSVIDTASNTVVATVGDPNAYGVAITPDGTRAYVTDFLSTSVTVIETANNTIIAEVEVGSHNLGVAITPDGTHAYVANAGTNSVSVIETATNTVTAEVPVGVGPEGVAITPDGTRAYVANPGNGSTDSTVSVIDTATNTVIATILVGVSPIGVAITPDGTRAYVTNEGSNAVSVIDTATNTVVATIPVGGHPFGIAITPSSPTTLTSSLNPSIYGQKVTFTATVAPSDKIMPTGKVNFTWSRFSIGSATLNSNGVATLTRSNLNADPYPLTARYGGDANNPASTSAVLNQVVQEARSAATLTSSPNPSTQRQAVTFTATITSPTVKPTGPVAFTAGKTVLGTVQLNSGKAKLTLSSLPVGSTKVKVTYYGDSNIAKSSASVTQTVR